MTATANHVLSTKVVRNSATAPRIHGLNMLSDMPRQQFACGHSPLLIGHRPAEKLVRGNAKLCGLAAMVGFEENVAVRKVGAVKINVRYRKHSRSLRCAEITSGHHHYHYLIEIKRAAA